MDTLAEFDAAIAAVHAEMAPLRERLRALVEDRRALADLLAEEADDDATLIELMEDSQVAYRKIEQRIRQMHPAFAEHIRWSDGTDQQAAYYRLLGPRLRLETDPDPDYLPTLETALVDFAARFCPEIPDTVARPGRVCAEIADADCAQYGQWRLFYQPVPGGAATLTLGSGYSDYETYDGTLPEMLAAAVKHTTRHRYPDDDC